MAARHSTQPQPQIKRSPEEDGKKPPIILSWRTYKKVSPFATLSEWNKVSERKEQEEDDNEEERSLLNQPMDDPEKTPAKGKQKD